MCRIEGGLRRGDIALGVAPQVALQALVVASAGKGFVEALCVGATGVAAGAGCVDLGREVGEAVALAEFFGRGGGRIGGCDEAVPAPEAAGFGDKALAGAEEGGEAAGICGVDEADLVEAALQQRAARDIGGERSGASG